MSITKKEVFNRHVLKLIHNKGFKAMTMRDIASKMNCDVANVYNYTPSKKHILESYLFEISNSFHNGIDEIISSKLNAIDKMKAIIHLHIQLSSTYPFRVALLINEWRNLEGASFKKFTKKRKAYAVKIARILVDGMESKDFIKGDPHILADSILGSLRWLYDRFVDSKTKLNPFDVEKQLVSFIMNGILTQK